MLGRTGRRSKKSRGRHRAAASPEREGKNLFKNQKSFKCQRLELTTVARNFMAAPFKSARRVLTRAAS